jgi:hypothetical protein
VEAENLDWFHHVFRKSIMSQSLSSRPNSNLSRLLPTPDITYYVQGLNQMLMDDEGI